MMSGKTGEGLRMIEIYPSHTWGKGEGDIKEGRGGGGGVGEERVREGNRGEERE